ncbi:MAG TPA: aminotransferase class IV [Pyrinomonadaceae bacterium]|nr:aminotransferase class IV [Pyrinomonadaceae bacterium]
MHAHIIYNHRLLKSDAACLPACSATSLYGRGVFTTVAVYKSRPFLWPYHWQRLVNHAERAGVDPGDVNEARVLASLKKLIKANGASDCRARIMLLRNSEGGAWKIEGSERAKTDLLIFTAEAHTAREDGLAITVSPFRLNSMSPLAGVKSINYLERVMALEEVRSRDFDEAVVMNEQGEVVSGIASNIFWVTHGTLHTPALQTGAVPGVTRAHAISIAGDLSFPIIEGAYELSQLADADEIFLTSAELGVALVTMFDFRRYSFAVGSVSIRMREAFREETLKVSNSK